MQSTNQTNSVKTSASILKSKAWRKKNEEKLRKFLDDAKSNHSSNQAVR
jgi:hypothetical protein